MLSIRSKDSHLYDGLSRSEISASAHDVQFRVHTVSRGQVLHQPLA